MNIHRPPEFDAIEDVQEIVDENAQELILEKEIFEAKKRLNSLKSEENKLREDYTLCKRKLENEKLDNEHFTQTIHTPTKSTLQFNEGSFFVQLRHIEAEIERWENEKETLIESNNHYEGELNRIRAQNHRLRKKYKELEDQNQNSLSLEMSKKGELKTLENQLFVINRELDVLKDTIENSKIKIKIKAEDLKTLSPNDLMAMKTQKEFLEKEVEQQRTVLENLQNTERTINTRFEVNRTQSKKRMEKSSLTSNWLNERNVLYSKLKNIRKEMKLLATRERGSMKTIEKIQHQVEAINYDNDEIKLALIAEKKKIPTEISAFLMNAMEVEKGYQQKLHTKLDQIDKAESIIQNFKASTIDVLQLTEENSEQQIRMKLLLNELHEFRKEALK